MYCCSKKYNFIMITSKLWTWWILAGHVSKFFHENRPLHKLFGGLVAPALSMQNMIIVLWCYLKAGQRKNLELNPTNAQKILMSAKFPIPTNVRIKIKTIKWCSLPNVLPATVLFPSRPDGLQCRGRPRIRHWQLLSLIYVTTWEALFKPSF